MAIEAYPVGANSGFSEESAIDSERDRLISALGGRMSDFIVDPFAGGHFDESHSGTSLDVTIDTGGTGMAFLGGHLVVNDAAITVTVDASSTNEIFLVVADTPAGNAQVIHTSDGSTPSGQHVMKIWEAVTDSSGVTGTTDFREYVPFREDAVAASITGRKAGTSGTIAIDTTGVKTASVTFTNPYQNAVDQANAWLNALGDTAAEFGYIRVDPTSISTTGFTIEAKVTAAGGSGTTADFDWEAYGK
ncbi:hypothetical protein HHTV1_38 [Haloarcula hispanica tailed virus 1]|uniref:Uncharacterized protein n=1 Tax=Haloarcula hispanica tailed virus 1 TaxID=1273750 RepID=R4TM98_9CAUD|nr:hypothetical protein M198_gp38 [Haloarcula hispanica tailed virus 1]AGM11293.1 hypothetical protein HHTV1_38 [Haloarcula hispanica tailed virus 1]